MASAAHGLPSVRIIVAGVRKMPTPTTWVTTIAVAAHGPSRAAAVRRHAVRRERICLERDARGQLHRARPARPEDAAGGRDRLTESRSTGGSLAFAGSSESRTSTFEKPE